MNSDDSSELGEVVVRADTVVEFQFQRGADEAEADAPIEAG
jgi:hypothetical protein